MDQLTCRHRRLVDSSSLLDQSAGHETRWAEVEPIGPHEERSANFKPP